MADSSQNTEGENAFSDFINDLSMHDEVDDLQGIVGNLDVDPAVAAVINASILNVRKTIEQVFRSGDHPIDDLTDLMQYIIYAIARIVEEMTDNTTETVLYTTLMMQAVVADIEEKGAEDQTFDWVGRIAATYQLPRFAYNELTGFRAFESPFEDQVIIVSVSDIDDALGEEALTEQLVEVITPVLVSAQNEGIDYIIIYRR